MTGPLARPLRWIEPDASGPGGWLLQGERMAVPGRDIWPAIRQSLQADPTAICVRCGDATLSRSQVLSEIERIAQSVVGRRVGVYLPRSVASVLTTLAIWCHGGAYVPIAADYPLARAQAIAKACRLDLVVSDRPLELDGYGRARAFGGDRPLFLHAREPDAPAPNDRDLCYIAHTSGSTGAPKSVEVSHENLLNRIACMCRFLDIGPSDCILYKTSPVFDVHVWEFTLPLVAGCRMVIVPQTRMFDLPEAARIMVADGVTVVGFVPVLLRMLLDMPGFVADNALRAVLCGGEAWGPALARDFHARLPGRRLYNSYGPAETTIAVANWPVPDDPALQAICLGGPLPNVAFLIMESLDCVTTAGGDVIGALCIGGAQVALGYGGGVGSGRFFTRVIDGHTMRFYATGDVVRLYRASGLVQFKGRQDNQVKVNGMRIELEEIEEAVCAIDHIEGCVAFVANSGQFSQLCLAYTTRDNVELASADIRRACARVLPAMLVPSRLQHVSALPLAENGKVDRAALTAGAGRAAA